MIKTVSHPCRSFSRHGNPSIHLHRLGFCLIAFLLFMAAFCRAEQIRTVLDHVREAAGHAALRSCKYGIVAQAQGASDGVESRFSLYLSPDSRFRMDTHSVLGNVSGFDGKTGWRVDASGMPGLLEYTGLELQMINFWLISGHWLDRKNPLHLDLNAEAEAFEDHILIKARLPGGHIESTIHIDATRLLPVKLSWHLNGEEQWLELSDYHTVSGFRFPHKIKFVQGPVPTTIEVESVRKALKHESKVFQPMAGRPDDTELLDCASHPVEVKKIVSGHIMVKSMLNSRDAGWFFLDTGAGMSCVDTSLANELKMKSLGEVTVTGVGGEMQVAYRKGESLTTGPVKITDPLFIEVELAPIGKLIGCELGGALGYDFFSRTLVELDPEEGRVRFFEPGAWDNRDAPWQEVVFDGGIPAIYCTLEGGLEGLFKLDTGSGATVDLHSGFTKKHNLLEERETTKNMAGGVGGFIVTYHGKLDYFDMGGHRFESPDVSFAPTDVGVFSDETIAGNIGLGFLSQFTMLIDYPRKRIAFLRHEDRQ